MSQPIKQEQIDAGNEDIRSIDGSGRTLEAISIGTIDDGNAQGNEDNSMNDPLLENSLGCYLRVPLPLELNCQIFECLKFGIQRKFIRGLGRGIYGIFRHKVLKKSKRLRNPEQNGWEDSNTRAIISFNGLLASDSTWNWPNIVAKKGFLISDELSRRDNFSGIILYYFEVTQMSLYHIILVGLSSGNISADSFVGFGPNSYAFQVGCNNFFLFGKKYSFEWPNDAIKPEWNGKGDVVGCGLLLNSGKKLSIFFTGNGILMGKQIPIKSTTISLYPTVSMWYGSVEANFGDDLAKPFKYDIEKCPGMGFE